MRMNVENSIQNKEYGILINRHPSLCQHNRHHLLITQSPHCQSSFCPPLKLSFQSHFSMLENISHLMISFSNPEGQHFPKMTHMRTYLVFGVPHLMLISSCIPKILLFIFLNKWCWSGDVEVTSWGRDFATQRFGFKAAQEKQVAVPKPANLTLDDQCVTLHILAEKMVKGPDALPVPWFSMSWVALGMLMHFAVTMLWRLAKAGFRPRLRVHSLKANGGHIASIRS